MKKWAPAALLILGLLQMTGDLFGLAALKGVGAAIGASPAPKVFSSVKGLETYSTKFFIEWTDQTGSEHSIQVTPDLNSRLRGPYNRRNVYGAVLAYGPVLSTDERTRPMFQSVAAYALCGDAPLLVELGLAPSDIAGNVRLRLEPRPGAELGALPLILEPKCP